jgi:hypothetical protein
MEWAERMGEKYDTASFATEYEFGKYFFNECSFNCKIYNRMNTHENFDVKTG